MATEGQMVINDNAERLCASLVRDFITIHCEDHIMAHIHRHYEA